MTGIEVLDALRRIAFELRMVFWALVALVITALLVDEREQHRRG